MSDQYAKPWYASKAVWGGVIAAVAGVFGLLGKTLTSDEQDALSSMIPAVIEPALALVGGIIAIVGRLKAKLPID